MHILKLFLPLYLIIIGIAGSAAEEYAEEEEITFKADSKAGNNVSVKDDVEEEKKLP